MKIKPFNTIGIGVTFSPNLKANIHEAARLAAFIKCKLILIHVGVKSKETEDTFNSILNSIITDNLDYEIVSQTGDPVEVILSTCQQKNIDLLVRGGTAFLLYYL